VNWRTVLSVLSYLLLLLALCLLGPLVVAIIYDSRSPHEVREIVAFAVTPALSLAAGAILRHKFKSPGADIGRREGFAIVTFSWVLVVLFGMIPYLITGVTHSVTDAFFETMSGFTTTGASIFSGAEIEAIPHGLQFWRCMTQWLGGMGIVVLSVALLSFLGVGGYRLLKAETPGGVAYEREQARITDAAKDLWLLYLGLSAVQIIAMKLAGATIYDAICHTFTTMSTGGFSPHGDSAAYFGPAIQWIIIAFMFLAGMSFSLHAHLFRGQLKVVLANGEARTYAAIILGCTLLGILVVPTSAGLEERVRDATFQVVSITTTTGFATKDYDQWPQLMRYVMLLLMFVGGCMGSTGGGMKVARLVIYAKALVRELHLLIYPHGIRPIRTGAKVVDPVIVSNILAFGAVYVVTFLFGAVVMAACGYELTTSASASAAALGNIGPGLAAVGPMENWAHLPVVAKWVMALLMLLGRLELFSVVVLFTPWAWKR
jgi:trk system potassium uptake protein TrkH